MNKHFGFSLLGALATGLLLAAPARAEDKNNDVGLGLAPGSPQVGTLPGGIQPSYGKKSEDESDYRFDYMM